MRPTVPVAAVLVAALVGFAVGGCSSGPASTPSSATATAPPSAAASVTTVTDACALITDAEIAAVTGFTPSDHSSVPTPPRCEWDALQPGQSIAAPLFDITINQTATATAVYDSSTPLGGAAQYPFSALTIPGVDRAAGSAGELHALVHGTYVVIIVNVGGNEQDWAPALMAKIAARL